MSIKRILIAGGGTLGTQSALQFALNGKKVTVYTHSAEAIDRTKTRLGRFAEVYKTQTDYETSDVDKALGNIECVDDIETAVSDTDLVFECLPEDKEIKRGFFTGIQKGLSPATI
ncbi:MAG TPA: hypothetical protein K8V54_04055, partial [Corynebacterium kroppenstedtii]|nr:hypothetical protein [Corynebacterium kroppenstedtii]